jgi:hypothetical protein
MGTLLPCIFTQNVNAELPSGDEIAQKVNARDEGVAVARNLKMDWRK